MWAAKLHLYFALKAINFAYNVISLSNFTCYVRNHVLLHYSTSKEHTNNHGEVVKILQKVLTIFWNKQYR